MGRIFQVVLVVSFTIVTYLIMIIVVPLLGEFASTTNTIISETATGNYASTQGFLLYIPMILWFVPFGIAIIVIMQILRGTS